MTTAVITIVAGRHAHLRNQQRGLRSAACLPDIYVVVSMGDQQALTLTHDGPLAGSGCRILTQLMATDGPLPLAAARNAGALAALTAGADTLIFLDVDCIPSAALVGTYTGSVRAADVRALHCGVVRYLDADYPTDELTAGLPGHRIDPADLPGEPHSARPTPEPGSSIASDDWPLFWSLSFAVSAATWQGLGGFDEAYVGYGAEDTDLGFAAHRRGINLVWVGGADAFHQYHPTTRLPVAHLHDILRNAGIFHRHWGFWPMEGWLNGFREAGLARFDARLGWSAR